jgi:hypothetical protein
MAAKSLSRPKKTSDKGPANTRYEELFSCIKNVQNRLEILENSISTIAGNVETIISEIKVQSFERPEYREVATRKRQHAISLVLRVFFHIVVFCKLHFVIKYILLSGCRASRDIAAPNEER